MLLLLLHHGGGRLHGRLRIPLPYLYILKLIYILFTPTLLFFLFLLFFVSRVLNPYHLLSTRLSDMVKRGVSLFQATIFRLILLLLAPMDRWLSLSLGDYQCGSFPIGELLIYLLMIIVTVFLINDRVSILDMHGVRLMLKFRLRVSHHQYCIRRSACSMAQCSMSPLILPVLRSIIFHCLLLNHATIIFLIGFSLLSFVVNGGYNRSIYLHGA